MHSGLLRRSPSTSLGQAFAAKNAAQDDRIDRSLTPAREFGSHLSPRHLRRQTESIRMARRTWEREQARNVDLRLRAAARLGPARASCRANPEWHSLPEKKDFRSEY